MTQKFDDFVKALETLCREHRVVLSTTGYESLAVFDAGAISGSADEQPIYGGVEDETDDRQEQATR